MSVQIFISIAHLEAGENEVGKRGTPFFFFYKQFDRIINFE